MIRGLLVTVTFTNADNNFAPQNLQPNKGKQRESLTHLCSAYCYIAILLYCYIATLLHWYIATLLYCYIAIFLHCYIAILLYCYIAILLHCYIAILLHCYIATLLYCYIATLLYCYIAILLYCYIAMNTLHLKDCIQFRAIFLGFCSPGICCHSNNTWRRQKHISDCTWIPWCFVLHQRSQLEI